MVGASGVNAVLIADNLPELGTDLVAALATLDVDDLTHLDCCVLMLHGTSETCKYEPYIQLDEDIASCVLHCVESSKCLGLQQSSSAAELMHDQQLHIRLASSTETKL